MLKHASLFSGIGGFDLAAEWAGWENVFHCEWEDFPRQVLKHYWPNAKSYGNIKESDFTIWRGRIDVLTGGFPCQPFSSAGKREGKNDDRHLWPEMLRAVREIQPRWIVGENVYGLLNWNGGMVFDEVQSDLEAEGYQVQPVILPAVSINAPHRRDRIWFIAYANGGDDRGNTGKDAGTGKEERFQEWDQVWQSIKSDQVFRHFASNPNSGGRSKGGERKPDFLQEWPIYQDIKYNGDGIWGNPGSSCSNGTSSNACSKGCEGGQFNGTSDPGIRRRETEQESHGSTSQLCEIPHWEKFPTQPPICGGNDGIPDQLDGITIPKWRRESIKAYGNAIVPQVAFEIFKVIDRMVYAKHIINEG